MAIHIAKTALPDKQEILYKIELSAPLERVYQIFTTPSLIPDWWGPNGLTTTVEYMEIRPGGRWRFIQQDDNGNEFSFHGVYHDIELNKRLVYTFEFEGIPGHVLLETITFEKLDDANTRITDQLVFQSVADRDGMMAAGSDHGTRESMERLIQLL